jgi:hypothetical protein
VHDGKVLARVGLYNTSEGSYFLKAVKRVLQESTLDMQPICSKYIFKFHDMVIVS